MGIRGSASLLFPMTGCYHELQGLSVTFRSSAKLLGFKATVLNSWTHLSASPASASRLHGTRWAFRPRRDLLLEWRMEFDARLRELREGLADRGNPCEHIPPILLFWCSL